MKRLTYLVAGLLCFALADCALAAPLGNQDVIDLLAAGMSEATVLQAVDSASPPTFDTTAPGLIKLKKAGASDAVIQRILARQSKSQPAPDTTAAAPRQVEAGECAIEAPSAEILYVRAGGQFIAIQYQAIKMDMEDKNVWAGIATAGIVSPTFVARARIDGPKSNVRLKDPSPVFLDMLFPVGRRDIDKMFYLMHLQTQPNSRFAEMTRAEGGVFSDAKINDTAAQTRIPIQAELVSETCKYHGKSFAQYRIKPQAPLEPGEYAYIQTTPGALSARVFDFGIDH